MICGCSVDQQFYYSSSCLLYLYYQYDTHALWSCATCSAQIPTDFVYEEISYVLKLLKMIIIMCFNMQYCELICL